MRLYQGRWFSPDPRIEAVVDLDGTTRLQSANNLTDSEVAERNAGAIARRQWADEVLDRLLRDTAKS